MFISFYTNETSPTVVCGHIRCSINLAIKTVIGINAEYAEEEKNKIKKAST